MTAENLINTAIPPLKLTDTIQTALNWMDKFRMSELPVIDNGKFVGFVTEKEIMDQNLKADNPISAYREFDHITVDPNQHYFEVVKVASREKARIVAVVNKEGEYLGVIPLKDTISMFSQMSAMQGPGAILVLSMEERNYSLAEISRLVEENNVKILSVHVGNEDALDDTHRIRVTIKLNSVDSSRIIATLERFGYSVLGTFSSEDLQTRDTDRLDMLFRYMDI